MKTTLDLPVDLVREMKLRAVHEGRKLKDVAAEILRRGLDAPERGTAPAVRHRIKLPLVPAKSGSPKFELTGERVHELEMEAEQESYDASLRH